MNIESKRLRREPDEVIAQHRQERGVIREVSASLRNWPFKSDTQTAVSLTATPGHSQTAAFVRGARAQEV